MQALWRPSYQSKSALHCNDCVAHLLQITGFSPQAQTLCTSQSQRDLATREGLHPPEDNLEPLSGTIPSPLEEQVYITADCFYKHNLVCLNYMTYDVCQAHDIINPSTSHCNIMLLADHTSGMGGLSRHPYIYAHVLGIFHVNATYVGPGMIDYCLHRVDFLWVCWYQHMEEDAGWDASTLDRVCFPPMAEGPV